MPAALGPSVAEGGAHQARAPTEVPALVRVTVVSAARRLDLALPGAVPVAELVPALARSVGVLDATTAHTGFRLLTLDGTPLAADSGLSAQGVHDGSLLTVASGVETEPPRVYDDVVEAMADVVERSVSPWDATSLRPTSWAAAVLLLLVGAGGLVLLHGSHRSGLVAGVVAVVLELGAVALSRAQGEPGAAVAVAWTGCAYAGIAGLSLGWASSVPGTPVGAAGAGAAAAGLVATLGLVEARVLLLPPVAVGVLFLAVGLLSRTSTFEPAVIVTAALVLVVLGGSLAPSWALAMTGTTVDRLDTFADPAREPDHVDPADLATGVRVAREMLLALLATVGLLLVLAAPASVSLGPAGCLIAILGCVVVLLRVRQFRGAAEVLVGLASGVLGLVSTAVAVLWLQPTWRPAAVLVLVAAGVLLLAATALPRFGSVRRDLVGDAVETVALLALLPLLVVASGVLDAIAR